MKIFFSYSLLSISLFSCEAKKSNAVELNPIDTIVSFKEKNECYDKQKKFLTWYLANYEKIGSVSHIVKYQKEAVESLGDSLSNASSTRHYQFSKKNMNSYLMKMKNIGFFSDDFIEMKRKSMTARGKVLDAEKQEDGPAEGFDFDEIFHTQEMYLETDINKLKVDSVDSNNYILPITKDFSWIIYTKKVNNTCLIDSISSR